MLKRILNLQLIEFALRIWTAGFVFIYGFFKYIQFEGAKLVDTPIQEASNFEMMWAFFGTTKAYPIFIGCIQMIGAILLVFRKTKLLGALLLTPVFLNIILLDILYGIPFGALLNALIFQAVFLFIIIQQRAKIKAAFQLFLVDKTTNYNGKEIVLRIVFAIGLAFLFFLGYEQIMHLITPY